MPQSAKPPNLWARVKAYFHLWSGRVHRHYGIVYADPAEFISAVEEYGRAMELNPRMSVAFLDRGTILWRELGRASHAVRDLTREPQRLRGQRVEVDRVVVTRHRGIAAAEVGRQVPRRAGRGDVGERRPLRSPLVAPAAPEVRRHALPDQLVVLGAHLGEYVGARLSAGDAENMANVPFLTVQDAVDLIDTKTSVKT